MSTERVSASAKKAEITAPRSAFSRRGQWQGFLHFAANLAVVERAEAEAIYDAGREACVEFILGLAARVEQLEDRLRRLEAAGAPGLAHEFQATVDGSAEVAGAAAGGSAGEGEGVDAQGG